MFAQQALTTLQQQVNSAGVDLGAARAGAEAERQSAITLRQDLRATQSRLEQLQWSQERSHEDKAALEAETGRVLSDLEATLAALSDAKAKVAELEAQLSQANKCVLFVLSRLFWLGVAHGPLLLGSVVGSLLCRWLRRLFYPCCFFAWVRAWVCALRACVQQPHGGTW